MYAVYIYICYGLPVRLWILWLMAWQNLLPATLYIHWNNLEQWKSSDYLPTGLFVFILRNSSAGFGPEGISYIMHMCGVCMRGSSFCFVFFVGQNLFIAIWSDLIFLTTKKWNVNNIAYTKQTLRYCPAATFASIYEPWIYGFFPFFFAMLRVVQS